MQSIERFAPGQPVRRCKLIKPRPAQGEILAYISGKMGISAVPGSGKTWTLSLLAARLIASGSLREGQEVLIVTLVNSAVENFTHRILSFLGPGQSGLIPAYRVRTLHGLAHDIVRERPSLVGVSENFQIIDEREAEELRDHVALAWMQGHPDALEDYLDPNLESARREWVRREPSLDLVQEIAEAFTRYAKDREITPERMRQRLDEIPLPLQLAEMGCDLYSDYQRALAYRGAVDFDDLIRLALQALRQDSDYLARLRDRWPYILEDEAQDSSRLQQKILRTLAGPAGNWVRVGDPNQAIYETFTTADPRHLRNFRQEAHFWRELPNSGRSAQSIIDLANYLVHWTQNEHPIEPVRDALALPFIQATPPDDPQPNPADDPSRIYLVARKYSPQEEIQAVVDSITRWLPDHPDWTVAALVPRNERGFQLVDALRKRGHDPVDSLLRSTTPTRTTADVLGNLLRYLSDPESASKLAAVYRVWQRANREDPQAWEDGDHTAELIRKCRHIEDFLWPQAGKDWLTETMLAESDPPAHENLLAFRETVKRWQGTVLLPIDQMLLTLSQDLFTVPNDLAITHKLAILLRRASNTHGDWRLPELSEELATISRNERRFLGFSEDDTGFDPEKYKGRPVVATLHKAKGLEWDRVYLLSVNNYDFPSGMPYDRYISEKWFLREGINLEAEALAQLEAALSASEYDWYEEGQATQAARLDYVRERLRLLYVGVTRARKELVITWNSGRKGDLQPALPFIAIQAYWEDRSE